ncbi:MAG: bifunctional hydroxymethylpyrimidine kinase/phosphomethylpyrimidine kinase [Candidatus Rokubacteria bacterium]|nr:bifunctional hydroxymethylpyrimidine kinase/phosphomethylpyrimidine kinase [Candidatus Rokubacteria bacterium]MBI2491492.1 bifunctional hydroxymethylpyrimidine kinase/phosphomethylpyrimidine kinase [Candidatus Rokubacteria bacterium]
MLVVGSVALDSVETPFGKVHEVLGGSATYFSYSASFFTQVRVVATVGEDFPGAHLRLLGDRGVDLDGLKTSKGKTFRWVGQYGYDLNEAKTLDTQLNVLAEFKPALGDGLRRTPFLFLANIDPDLQRDVLRQMKERPRLVALDTMNFWIQGKQEALRRVLADVDVVTINDGEARQLAGEPNLIRAARAIASMGPRTVVVKRGEYGALMLTDGAFFFVPAYPLESVYDPTGAGDTFAGGFMGYLAAQERIDAAAMRRAVVYGSVMASFTVEDFSLKRLTRLRPADIADRYTAFHDLIRLDGE